MARTVKKRSTATKAKTEEVEKPIEEQLEDYIESGVEPTTIQQNKKLINENNLVGCGSTLINLSATETPYGCFMKGRYFLIVGQPSAGKTWISHNVMAEAVHNPAFKYYQIIFDNTEEGTNFDVAEYFGPKTAKAISPPEPGRKDADGMPNASSRTVEQFYDSVEKYLDIAEGKIKGEKARPVMYFLDSLDGLSTEKEVKETEQGRKKRASGKQADGSYGDGKAKINSSRLRQVCARLDRTGSMLFIITQEKVAIGSMHNTKTFSGGVAITYYSTAQLWAQIRSKITITVNGKDRDIGTLTKFQIVRNRMTGKRHRDILVPILWSVGIDDIGSLVDWLIEEKRWTGGKAVTSKISTNGDFEDMSRENLIRHIENNNMEKVLSEIVLEHWMWIQDEIANKVVRKRKFQ